MSAVTIGGIERRAPALQKQPPDPLPRGIALSAALHVVVLVLVLLGLPNLFRSRPVEETPIAVELVTIAPHTHATHRNKYRPQPKAKPEPAEAPPAPVPERKPQPMPTSAAPSSSPPPPPPPERPEPAKRETHEPPPPPPPPKPVEAKAEPQPKPPEPKPRHETRHEKQEAPPETRKAQAAAFDKLIEHLDQRKPDQPKTASFDSLLNNLTRDAPASTQEDPPQPHRAAAAAAPSSQPMAPLDSRLTASEIDLLRQQIERCWVVPAGARDAKDLDIEIKAAVNPDGTVREARIVNMARYASDPFFRAAADSAKRAVLNPQCSPLHLPPDKYEAWHNLDLFFNPKDVL
jgi:hypothetical protein